MFSPDVSRGYKNGTLGSNGLIMKRLIIKTHMRNIHKILKYKIDKFTNPSKIVLLMDSFTVDFFQLSSAIVEIFILGALHSIHL